MPLTGDAQAVDRNDVDGDDRQGPERVRRQEEHLRERIEAQHGDTEPLGYDNCWVVASIVVALPFLSRTVLKI